jgi:hypothetical protein
MHSVLPICPVWSVTHVPGPYPESPYRTTTQLLPAPTFSTLT